MGCISNVSFAVLINGAASPFFKSQRGLRQGCPLSPLLFLLVAEGLSRLIHKARRTNKIKGIEVAINLYITRLLFVDDILLFSNGSHEELKEYKKIIDLFMKATGMQLNYGKSQVCVAGYNRRECNSMTNLFPFHLQPLASPFKYLGFWLKLDTYKKEDWSWLIAKIEARISHWSFRWLSRAGRLTLLKSILMAIPVYWAALTWIPKGIMEKIRRLCCRFLWSGSNEKSVLPWVAWDKIARPKDWGRWGIKRLPEFSLSLAAKSGWRLITMVNLWTWVIRRKYIDPTPLEDWIRSQEKKSKQSSVIWKATIEGFSVIEQGPAWKVGDGRNVKIGRDPWVGCNESFALSPSLLRHLDGRGGYSPKEGYSYLMEKKGWSVPEWWSKNIWKLKCPMKSRIFLWCMLRRKIPTWDILQSRFFIGPGRCPLCKENEESINHLFTSCTFSLKLWGEITDLLKLKVQWGAAPIENAWKNCWNNHPDGNLRNLPPIFFWGIWLARNKSIFQDQVISISSIASNCVAIYSSIPPPDPKNEQNRNNPPVIKEGTPWAFFDGASQENKAGAGICIHINQDQSFKASVGLGQGTNNYVELVALRLLLCWALKKNILTIQIFRDSMNVVKWVNGTSMCQNQILKILLDDITTLKTHFNCVSIYHIYREHNATADQLSKSGLQQAMGN
eukprot:PITA_17324